MTSQTGHPPPSPPMLAFNPLMTALAQLADPAQRGAALDLLRAQRGWGANPVLRPVLLAIAAFNLGREAPAARFLRAAGRRLGQAGRLPMVAALAAACRALAAHDPAAALALLAAAEAPSRGAAALWVARLRILVDQRRWPEVLRLSEDHPVAYANGSLDARLRALAAVPDWAAFQDCLVAAFRDADPPLSRGLLRHVQDLPEVAVRHEMLARMAASGAARLQELTEHEATALLAVLHSLGREAALLDAHAVLRDRLPAAARTYFDRRAAQLRGAPPPNRIWAVGLGRTGTTSLHRYLCALGIFAAHCFNPLLGRPLDAIDLELFDAVSDTPVVAAARREGVPDGRLVIATTRDFTGWQRSAFDLLTGVTGTRIADEAAARRWFERCLASAPHHPMTQALEETVFGFPTLRAAHDAHADWLAALAARHPRMLLLPLDAPDKARRVSAFLGEDVPVLPYPHSNRSPA